MEWYSVLHNAEISAYKPITSVIQDIENAYWAYLYSLPKTAIVTLGATVVTSASALASTVSESLVTVFNSVASRFSKGREEREDPDMPPVVVPENFYPHLGFESVQECNDAARQAAKQHLAAEKAFLSSSSSANSSHSETSSSSSSATMTAVSPELLLKEWGEKVAELVYQLAETKWDVLPEAPSPHNLWAPTLPLYHAQNFRWVPDYERREREKNMAVKGYMHLLLASK